MRIVNVNSASPVRHLTPAHRTALHVHPVQPLIITPWKSYNNQLTSTGNHHPSMVDVPCGDTMFMDGMKD